MPNPYIPFPPHLRTIKKAAADQTILRLHYADQNGKETVREVEPYEIKGDTLYAFCLHKNGIRTFKLEQIKGVDNTPVKFDLRFENRIK